MQEIWAISCIFWSRRRDSNPRPLRPERNALPTALRLDLAFFVSGQTCGQTTHFGIFSLSCTGKIVRFFKAFSDSQNLQAKVGSFAPEYDALPTVLWSETLKTHTLYQMRYEKSNHFPLLTKVFLFFLSSSPKDRAGYKSRQGILFALPVFCGLQFMRFLPPKGLSSRTCLLVFGARTSPRGLLRPRKLA